MTIENQHISMYKGDSRRLVVSIVDFDSGSIPLNLQGCTVSWVLQQMPQGKELLQKSQDDGSIEIADASKGIVHVRLYGADTDTLKPGQLYKHMLRVRTSEGIVSTVTTGDFRVKV